MYACVPELRDNWLLIMTLRLENYSERTKCIRMYAHGTSNIKYILYMLTSKENKWTRAHHVQKNEHLRNAYDFSKKEAKIIGMKKNRNSHTFHKSQSLQNPFSDKSFQLNDCDNIELICCLIWHGVTHRNK